MSEIWEIYYRDGRIEQVECREAPSEIKTLADQRVIAVQVVPVAGEPYAVRVTDAYRFKKLVP